MNGDNDSLNIPILDEPGDQVAQPVDNVPVLDENAVDDGLPRHAARQDDGSVILPLLRPVTLQFRRTGSGDIREEVVAQLHMHRMTGADMNALSSTSAESRGALSFARSSRMAPGKMKLLYDRMDAADVLAGASVIAFFLDSGAKTGL